MRMIWFGRTNLIDWLIYLLTATCSDWHIENNKNHTKVIIIHHHIDYMSPPLPPPQLR